MELQALAYKPLYLLLADYLEHRIRSGDFPEGSYLPPIRRLMKMLNVSLATVRKALEKLEAVSYTHLTLPTN